MNSYFLVEGSAELSVYPAWIEYFTDGRLTRCAAAADIVHNNYFIFNGGGAGTMKHHSIVDSIREISANPVFDYFVVVIDAEDQTVRERKQLVERVIEEATIALPDNCTIQIIVQKVCFETWLCGHTDYFLRARLSTDRHVRMFVDDYDMESFDPEDMPANPADRPILRQLTIGKYHFLYLSHMLRPNAYGKSRAGALADISYLRRLLQRRSDTPTHLQTLQDFVSFMDYLRLSIEI